MDNVAFIDFVSNQYFGLFNTFFHFKDIILEGKRVAYGGDIGWDIAHGYGIIENSKVMNKDPYGVDLDHIIDISTMPVPVTFQYVDEALIREKNPTASSLAITSSWETESCTETVSG